MNMALLDKIQGKEVRIINFNIFNDDCHENTICIITLIECDIGVFKLQCFNASQISIYKLSAPMEVGGFEILSNKEKMWEKSVRYRVHDFENEMVDFLCEDINISALE